MPRKTDTTERVYDYLKGYVEKNGHPPEIAKIKEYFGFGSMGTIYYHINRLEKQGLIEIGKVRDMKKFSDLKVKGAKMRNLDAFNAMSREGQRNILVQQLEGWDFLNEESIEAVVEDLLDWLYSPAE